MIARSRNTSRSSSLSCYSSKITSICLLSSRPRLKTCQGILGSRTTRLKMCQFTLILLTCRARWGWGLIFRSIRRFKEACNLSKIYPSHLPLSLGSEQRCWEEVMRLEWVRRLRAQNGKWEWLDRTNISSDLMQKWGCLASLDREVRAESQVQEKSRSDYRTLWISEQHTLIIKYPLLRLTQLIMRPDSELLLRLVECREEELHKRTRALRSWRHGAMTQYSLTLLIRSILIWHKSRPLLCITTEAILHFRE